MTVRLHFPLLVLLAAFVVPAVAQETNWAAALPDSERRLHVGYGATTDEAEKQAINACRRVSTSCADSAAITDEFGSYFQLSCCLRPRTGCVVYVIAADVNRRTIAPGAAKDFADAGFSVCSVVNARPVQAGE